MVQGRTAFHFFCLQFFFWGQEVKFKYRFNKMGKLSHLFVSKSFQLSFRHVWNLPPSSAPMLAKASLYYCSCFQTGLPGSASFPAPHQPHISLFSTWQPKGSHQNTSQVPSLFSKPSNIFSFLLMKARVLPVACGVYLVCLPTASLTSCPTIPPYCSGPQGAFCCSLTTWTPSNSSCSFLRQKHPRILRSCPSGLKCQCCLLSVAFLEQPLHTHRLNVLHLSPGSSRQHCLEGAHLL